jgi:threonine dehydratase
MRTGIVYAKHAARIAAELPGPSGGIRLRTENRTTEAGGFRETKIVMGNANDLTATQGGDNLGLPQYLQKILNARVYDVAIQSPLELAPLLSTRLGNKIWLKREDTQPTFSFKLRGAYNKMAHLTSEQLGRGVICASAGNHAQGVALGAHRLGCRALIVMPTTTPALKVDAVLALGAEVILFGDSYSEAYGHAIELERSRGLTFVHPFDDPDVIAGQGTIAVELLRQHERHLDAIFVAIGGGGLISGIAAYVKAV